MYRNIGYIGFNLYLESRNILTNLLLYTSIYSCDFSIPS